MTYFNLFVFGLILCLFIHQLDASSEGEDLISKLPDDILVDIISRLNLEEAARTSILSSRWKYLWNLSTVLNFHAPRKLWKIPVRREVKRQKAEANKRQNRYIRWVNEVLKLHRGSSINEFRICFQLGVSHERVITDWINTVIAKRVQNLELNLEYLGGIKLTGLDKKYTFPQEWNNIFETPQGLSGIESLRSLSLVNVCVTREALEFFIYNCPLLERLRVENSESLSGLKVFGSKIQLKYLDIYDCFLIDEIEICAPSLLSFKYYGGQIKLNVENVPLLRDVSIGGDWIEGVQLKNLIEPVRSYLTQLETLELLLDLNEDDVQFSICELRKLRHLTFNISGDGSKNFHQLTGFIHACPFLQKLTLKFCYSRGIHYRRRTKVNKFPKCSRQHLKMVELIGFLRHQFDLDLLCYLLQNAVRLEKMIVNPTNPSSLGKYWEFEDGRVKKLAKRCAEKLEAKIPHGVKFVIC